MKNICRLCGCAKSFDELVISLQKNIGIVSFKEFIEYYCRITLKSDPDLPQKVCLTCKDSVVKFSEFSYSVEKQQSQLEKEDQKAIKIKTESRTEDSSGYETEINEDDIQPSKKKQKFAEDPMDSLLITILECDDHNNHDQFHDDNNEKQRRISSEKPKESVTKLSETLASVEKIFGKVDPSSDDFDHISINLSELKKDGEVPINWLKQYKDSETWKEIKFTCNCPCKKKFENFDDFFKHQQKLPKEARHFFCNSCDKTTASSTSSIINHTTRTHLPFAKFCCIVCSKVFYNLPYLSRHYRDCHPNSEFNLFPCLECGTYYQNKSALISHKKSHGKGSRKK